MSTSISQQELTCMESTEAHVFTMVIVADDSRRHYLAMAQYLGGLHEVNPARVEDPQAPQERMLLHFATAEVTLLGSHLNRIEAALREGRLVLLKPVSSHHASAVQRGPVLFSITVAPKDIP
jgi:hypothetical protein